MVQLNAHNFEASKKIGEDKIIIKHLNDTVSIWNVEKDFCEFVFKYKASGFCPFWAEKYNLFVYGDAHDTTLKSINLKQHIDKAKVEYIGLRDL